jgi:hypothetical protein
MNDYNYNEASQAITNYGHHTSQCSDHIQLTRISF